MAEQLLIESWGTPYHVDDSGVYALIEAKVESDGPMYIEGVFMQADVVNRNGRRYPKKVMEKAVDKYITEQVVTRQALGELNHPSRSNVDPAEAAIRITELWWDGANVMGKAIVLDTTKGKEVQALIKGGWVPGVSSRGLGSVKQVGGINEVQDFRLTVGVDVVWGPSAPNAYVRAVNESTQHPAEKAAINTPISENSDENSANLDADFAKLAETLEKLL
ncbi:head maturation protease [Vibrio phage D479]